MQVQAVASPRFSRTQAMLGPTFRHFARVALERFHGSVIHKGDSLSGLALIPLALNREGVFDEQGLL